MEKCFWYVVTKLLTLHLRLWRLEQTENQNELYWIIYYTWEKSGQINNPNHIWLDFVFALNPITIIDRNDWNQASPSYSHISSKVWIPFFISQQLFEAQSASQQSHNIKCLYCTVMWLQKQPSLSFFSFF